ECPAQTTGWTRNTGAGWTAFGSCNETKTGTAISAYCNAGVLKHTAGSSSAWSGTATIETPLQAKAGAYVNAQTCAQCAKGSYAEAIGTQTSCTACQPNEATTSAPGATSMISCFVPASENLTDSKGTYNFSTDCSWTQ
ncbi:MAG: hypothetical protein LBT45_01615, partial [Rickettsiales bacterium]|nr:hypothetical protein [Rickettsiales bacterium]